MINKNLRNQEAILAGTKEFICRSSWVVVAKSGVRI